MSKARYANVGGQAVMEGIMMRSPKKSVLAVRTPDGSITTETVKYFSIRDRIPLFRIPILRGAASFVESFVTGIKSIIRSADLAGLDEDEPGKKKGVQDETVTSGNTEENVSGPESSGTDVSDASSEKCGSGESCTGEKKSGEKSDSIPPAAIAVAVIMGVALAVGLFIFLPVGIRRGLEALFSFRFGIWTSVFEGILKIVIFIAYLLLVSRMKDIQRLFEYHGAEHKTIFCFEAGLPLTVENIRKQSRLHPRCGTSFLIIVMLVSIAVSLLLPKANTLLYILIKILILPVIAGISFEFIRLAGRYDNLFTRIISAPGKALQLITTKEPADDQIEVAIAALNASLTDDDGNIDTAAAYSDK